MQQSSSYRVSYTSSAYPSGSSQIMRLSSKEQNLQDVVQTLVYTIKHHQQHILTDNETQFKGVKFARCCSDFGIHHQASSAAHPQTNIQVEQANKLILQGMKARMFHDLEAKGRNWHKELPSLLCALCTNINIALEILPFIWYTGLM
jgi:transposase InsO family protein